MTDRSGRDGIHPVRVMSTAAHAVVELVMAFRLETIREGDQLPTIPALSDSLGISPAVAQSAIATLAESGVLQVKRGRNGGIWLRDLAAITDALCKVLPVMKHDDSYIEYLLDVRRIMQSEAAVRTARYADERVRSQLRGHVERMRTVMDRTSNFLKNATQLNCAIALHCRNPVLADRLIRLIDEIAVAGARSKRRLREHPGVVADLFSTQQKLVDAIAADDPARIRAAVAAQMELSLKFLK